MSQSSSSNQSNVGTSGALEKFPSNGRETADFRDWLFKAEAVLLSRNMLDVVNEPIVDFPVKRGESNVVPASCNTEAKIAARKKIVALSATAYHH